MQYMLLCYHDETRWEALPRAKRDEVMDAYGRWVQSIVKSGHLRASSKLRPSADATTLREQHGKRVTVDGPFAETKEQLGGFHLIECRDRDEAIEIAGRIPTLPTGGTVEVRPVEPIPSQ